jgi:GNAT superfamily N-acetyltransferase
MTGTPDPPRRATHADLPALGHLVRASYAPYLARMDRPPAPMVRDVHPDAQGTGLGRRLMDFAEEQARRGGFRRLTLYTNEVMTENLGMYEHLGYKEVERRRDEGYRRVFMEKLLGEG